MKFKYHLDKTSKKFLCPNCGKKTLVRYIDNDFNHYLEDHLGRCDREVKCGYFSKPTELQTVTKHLVNNVDDKVYLNKNLYDNHSEVKTYQKIENSFGLYIYKTALKYLGKFYRNFYVYDQGNEQTFFETMDRYQIGFKILPRLYDQYLDAYVFFPIIDQESRLHYVQAKIFDKNGHTIKKSTKSYAKMYHCEPRHYADQTYKISALFGEHIVKDINPNNTIIIIVEAPKTAVLLDYIYHLRPDLYKYKLIFMSCMSLGLFSERILKNIKKFKIVAIPDYDIDAKAYSRWIAVETKLNNKGYDIDVKGLTPNKIGPTEDGWDIADYIRYNNDFKLDNFLKL